MTTVHIDLGDNAEIRTYLPDDAETVFAVMDAERERLGDWLPWVDTTPTSAETRAFILRSLDDEDAREGLGIWVGDELAGGLGLHVDAPMKSGEIGYWVRGKFQGRGLVTKACRALLDLGFGELGLHRIVICSGIENTRSRAIPERLGFAYEGILRESCQVGDRFLDMRCYSMLDREWAAAKE